ncbi:MAG: hypothetical protein HQL07_13475 [Nitrospirae bacterium]|nr:hypothetical protein [Magnetococcales bacterium]HAT50205.1 hypothetical protein [Alphaproteobacteria bacterium]
MEFNSVEFFVFFLFFAVLFNARQLVAYKQIILFGANVCFIATFSESVLSFLPLFGFVTFGYMLILYARLGRSELFYLLVSFFVIVFIYIKKYSLLSFIPSIPFPYVLVGLSYILFKILHLLIDIHGGYLRGKISFLEYFNYLFFFPCFVSGPIQRYQDFSEQIHRDSHQDYSSDEVVSIFSRITSGFFKFLVFAAIFSQLYKSLLINTSFGGGSVSLAGRFAVIFIAHGLYIYFNFSGFIDIVIGLGRLLGIHLPENFNKPHLSENFLDFWSRWHITMSEWFKFYIFNPLLKVLYTRVSPGFASFICYVITFLFMGIWHGTTLIFFLYGLVMGFGAGVNKLYQSGVKHWIGKKGYNRLKSYSSYRLICRAMTAAYFSMSIICFISLNNESFGQIVLFFESVNLLLSYVVTTVLIVPLLMMIDMVSKVRNFTDFHFFRSDFWLAFKIIILFNAVIWLGSGPREIVYKVF